MGKGPLVRDGFNLATKSLGKTCLALVRNVWEMDAQLVFFNDAAKVTCLSTL